MNKRPTLADVAARAGMSKTAVSLVLNNRPGSRLSDDAVARIHEAARELDYRPNAQARSLRLGTTGTVGFISDDVTVTRFASPMIRGLLDAADEQDRGVLIAETFKHPKQLRKAMEAMVDRQVDGLIFGALSARLVDLPPLPAGMRAVTVNCVNPEVPVAVLPDEEQAGYAVTRQLLDAGHAAGLAIIGNAPVARSDPRVSVTINRRFTGIQRALDESGVSPVAVEDIEFWEPWNGYDATKRVLESDAPVTALLCLNDRVAFGAHQALTERGLRVPDDVSIASFDDDEIASYMRPALTTARLPYEQMGRQALELLLQPEESPGERLVEMPLQVRESIRSLT
ncbi:LacI family DNA-binding transcriptional regulator [Terrabacter sp. C0L_2]|uniref:LacI family DNA-binding transcriptional regulator n=1 Tax=Terrabacter sp. C0L_2 TaxID=3108389 RepID=UPI002ED5B50E|nr:LacI family DNA-binding transcriptional regulator [Terrabacter sp. C0L_2]